MQRLKALAVFGGLLLVGAAGAHAQTPAKGDLLIATDEMQDSTFAESVLLVVHHDENASIAVLINRPTFVVPSEVFPELAELPEQPERLFFGGPVQPSVMLMLVRQPPPGLILEDPVVPGVYLSGNPEVLEAGSLDIADEGRFRLYAGHARWEPGQLETEIFGGNWNLVQGRADIVFSDDPSGLWREVQDIGSELVVEHTRRGTPVDR